ncbi:Glycosyl transferase family 2 [Bradyrhizobium lablabi]|uniref:Glycosyl transferase family 2 n=1 Tax=Bradyrhizobium lablabi TaxID=722472 RepID=A0A1M7BGI0_9BRAD|nr:glycosyltransferase [Bradyrhizobium lablabi]SHL54122.1 Glycosyl transferase family 2 [Bradyrhizobium lablabi]
MPDLAPIVLFVYNRPDHTRQTLAALAANPLAADSNLIVYADGPKRPEHRTSVHAVRDLVRRTSGFKSIEIVEREANLGLANSIVSGVSEVCADRGRVIVVEDDLVVSPDFLAFLNAGLERYADERNVMQISAYAFPAHDQSTSRTFFLPMASCWGWATWSRAWAAFDPRMSALAKLDDDPVARRRFNIDDAYDYYGMACLQRQGKIDSWGICWQLSLFACGGLVLYPRDSLVYNAGIDASGTHGMGQTAFQRKLENRAIEVGGLTWPAMVAADESAMAEVKQLLRANRPGVLRRIIGRLRA